ncbi:MAG TPA: hypothetical protein VF588_05625 [Pyrinomonadaceae bacterium]
MSYLTTVGSPHMLGSRTSRTEHLLPLFVALRAGSDGGGDVCVGRAPHRGLTLGSLSMAAYNFGSVD